uniref:Uncharacterized protein n=1 Tax=Anguilla anguilla TaxID=7936 RepID=A0A0E9XJG8_ANGAN
MVRQAGNGLLYANSFRKRGGDGYLLSFLSMIIYEKPTHHSFVI